MRAEVKDPPVQKPAPAPARRAGEGGPPSPGPVAAPARK